MLVDAVLDALGNPNRRAILAMLAAEPRPVGDIARHLPISRPAVSKHLKILEEARLVTHDDEGTRHVFRVAPEGFDVARSWLEQFWPEALARLVRVAHDAAAGAHDGGT